MLNNHTANQNNLASIRPVSILGIAGSLRSDSYNRLLLRAAQGLAPDGITINEYDISDLPMYNQDDDGDNPPATVARFKEALTNAGALLIATPEYNHSIPGVLKNALDWASRPMGRSPLSGKVAAGMGAATGQWGTVRAQQHLRDILLACGVHYVQRPQVLVARAREKFSSDGELVDEMTQRFLIELLEAMRDEYALRHAHAIPHTN